MLKSPSKQAFLSITFLVTAVLFICLTFGFIPRELFVCPPANDLHPEACSTQNLILAIGLWTWWRLVDDNGVITAFATVGIVAYTAVLAFVSNRQAELALKGINLARDEFIATHRPKIRIKHVWLMSDIWHGVPVKFDLVIVNTGMTPAVIHEYKFAIFVLRSGVTLPAHILSPGFLETISMVSIKKPNVPPIQSGITHSAKGLTNDFSLDSIQHRNLREGRVKLYIVGSVEYADPERVGVRTTGFCRFLDIPNNAAAASHLDVGSFRRVEGSDYDYED